SMVSYARHTTPENLKSVTGRQVLALKDIQQEKLNLAEASRQDTLAQAGKTQIAEPLVQEVIAAYQQRPLLDEHLLNDPVFKQKRQKALDYLYAPTNDVNLIQAKDEALAQLKSAALKNKIGQFQNPQYNEAQNQAMREKLTELVDEYYGQPATLPALADLQQPLALPSNDQYRILREGILAQVQAEQASRDAFLTEVWQGVQQQKLNK
ncbi:MAG: hypothetical protein J6Y94_07235, partial [Bacteriovoracaceae bacterium]|nr:hypothetical protein [Bacteriovoracaceae bacterium]